MSWSVYLPIAGNSVNVFILLGLGGTRGFLSGLFGVGGGFLMTPLLMMVGIRRLLPPHLIRIRLSQLPHQQRTPTIAWAMSISRWPAASDRWSRWRNPWGAVDQDYRSLGNADFVIKITYVVMFGVVGSYMFVGVYQRHQKEAS